MSNTSVSMLLVCLVAAEPIYAALPCGVGFQAPVNYSTGDFVSAAATADLNHDGKRDLIVANTGSGTITVLLGNGSGGFAISASYTSGTYPDFVAVTDFNRDRHDDVAVANAGSGNVKIFLGNGTGMLTPSSAVSAGSGSRVVRTGDFNRDGKADVVVSNLDSANLTVAFGNGDGTFQAAVHYAVPSGPWSVTVADLNQDGILDLVAPSIGDVNVVSVLFGNPDGSFQSGASLPAGTSPADVAVGDLNRDGKPDLVISNVGGANVSVMLGTGGGGFGVISNYPAGNAPAAVRLADFNGDGLQDVLVSNHGCCGIPGGVNLMLGNVNGTLQPRIAFPAGTDSRYLSVDDFNNDGRLDLAVPNAVSDDVSILLGYNGTTPYGGFGTVGPTYATGQSPYGIATGDLNRDGKPDIVTANVGSDTISVLLGAGAGVFQPSVAYAVAARPLNVILADFNRDGRLDVAVASLSGYVTIMAGIANGTFGAALTISTQAGTRDIVAIDYNGDGKLDIAAINEDANSISLIPGNGDGTFGFVSAMGLGGRPQSMAAGDFNQDGKVDIAIGMSGTPNLAVLHGQGNGSFTFQTQGSATTVYRSMVAGDFNSDGRLDLLVANSNGMSNAFGSILFGDGNGAFQSPINSAVPEMPVGIAMGDLNGDGKPDFLVTSQPSAMVTRRGDGSGGFVNDGGYMPGGNPTGIAIADFNQDGRLDLAITRTGANNVMVFLNMPPFRPNVVLTSSNSTPAFGQPVTFIAVVTPVATSCNLPTGRVYFQAGTVGLGEFTLDSMGVASVETSALAAGPHSVVAAYRGDNLFHAQESSRITVTVMKALATLTLSNLTHTYDGTPKQATVTTNPPGLGVVTVTYNGSTTTPVNPGSYAVVATLANPGYEAAPATGTLVVINPDNTPPLVSGITASSNPAPVGTPVTLSAQIRDSGRGGSLIAGAEYSVDLGVSWQPIPGAYMTAPDVTVSVSLSLPVGVYPLCIRAKDAALNMASECGPLLAIYDAAGGFVTGGGWIESPLGAFPANTALTGKANFGFSSKYGRGTNVPGGETQFRFQTAGVQFKSTAYEWLVVSGARAQFKGNGTINGTGDYGFMLTAIDGQVSGGGGLDRFRIKIWDRAGGEIVYDNQPGAGDADNASTELGGGSIIIHAQ